MRNRAFRKHQKERINNKRKNYFTIKGSSIGYKNIEHPKACSCWMCGNPRKFFKQKTLKESLSDIIMKEMLEECQIS